MSAHGAPAAAQVEDLATEVVAEERIVEQGSADDTAIEDRDTELAENSPAPAPFQAESADAAAARRAAAEQVRTASGLAPGVRERLAEAVAAGGRIDADGRLLVALDDALQALAESLPSALRLSAGDVQRPEHPGGSAFFRTTPEGELSDDEAEAIARGQLARSGLLRGQRVRAAQD